MKTQKKLAGSSVKMTSPNAESPPTAMAPIKTRGKTKQIRFFLTAMLLLPLGIALGKPANAQENWVYEKGGAVPLDAVAGGAEGNGTLIYICRAFYSGGVHPGRVRPGTGGCHIGWGGTEHVIPFYEVLVPEWASASNGSVPTGAYPYGEEANAGPFLYSCRGYLNGSMHPGKVRVGLPGCSIGWGGKSVLSTPIRSFWKRTRTSCR